MDARLLRVPDGVRGPVDVGLGVGALADAQRLLELVQQQPSLATALLRAEALAPQLKPGAIVAAFIADDIRRTEMQRLWGAEKPYFDLDGDRLLLRNVPVSPRPDPRTTLTLTEFLLGRSYLFDFVLRRLDLIYDWFNDRVRVHPAGTGERIACALTGRLAAFWRLEVGHDLLQPRPQLDGFDLEVLTPP